MIIRHYFKGYSNPIGKEIFRMFGIDPILYAQTFNDYPHSKKMPTVDVSSKCDKSSNSRLYFSMQLDMDTGWFMVVLVLSRCIRLMNSI